MKTLFASWTASRLERRARELRRALRDYQRQESAHIFSLEKRSRGLRLFKAWSSHPKLIKRAPSMGISSSLFQGTVKAVA